MMTPAGTIQLAIPRKENILNTVRHVKQQKLSALMGLKRVSYFFYKLV